MAAIVLTYWNHQQVKWKCKGKNQQCSNKYQPDKSGEDIVHYANSDSCEYIHCCRL